jgi:hypothetical protein
MPLLIKHAKMSLNSFIDFSPNKHLLPCKLDVEDCNDKLFIWNSEIVGYCLLDSHCQIE